MKKFLALLLVFLLNAQPVSAAITHIGALLNSCGEATSDTSLDCTTSVDLEADNVGLFGFVSDNDCNNAGAATTSNTNEHTSATIDGNAMTKIREVCSDVDDPGGVNAGLTISFWLYRATGTISSGAAVVFNLAGAKTAKAAIGREIGVVAGNTLQSAGGEQDAAFDSLDPGTMTISGLSSAETLFCRLIGLERTAGGTFTPTTSYTSMGVGNGDAGTDPTSAQARGECRVLTATGDTSNPSISAIDNVNSYIAFREVLAASPDVKSQVIFIQ